MKNCLKLLLIVLAGLILDARAEEQSKSPENLIKKLRSDDFDERQAAVKQLTTLGQSAREALTKALHDSDPEIRINAETILRNIDLSAKGMKNRTINVRVLDSENLPLRNVKGSIHLSNGLQSSDHDVVLNEKGCAVLPLKFSGEIQMFPYFPGFSSNSESQLIMPNLDDNYCVFRGFAQNGSVSGRVVDNENRPIKGAVVSLIPEICFDPENVDIQLKQLNGGNSIRRYTTVSTDENGAWQVQSIAQNYYSCIVSCDGYASAASELIKVRPRNVVNAPVAKLLLAKKGKLILRLHNVDGSLLQNKSLAVLAEIYRSRPFNEKDVLTPSVVPASRIEQKTNQNGILEMPNLWEGDYKITVWLEEGSSHDILLSKTVKIKKSSDTILEYQLQPASNEIIGRICDSEGEGIGGFTVQLAPILSAGKNENSDGSLRHTTSDRDGFYRFRNQPPGDYEVRFYCNPENCDTISCIQNIAYRPKINIKALETIKVPDLTFLELHKNRNGPQGHVTLPDGTLAENFEAFYFSNHCQVISVEQTKGHFSTSVRDLMIRPSLFIPHDFVYLKAQGYKSILAEVQLDSDSSYMLEADHFGSIRATIKDLNGRAVPGVKVWFASNIKDASVKRAIQVATTDNRGIACFGGIVSGKRLLCAYVDGYYLPDTEISVPADEEISVELILHPSCSIRGQIHAPENSQYDGISLCLDETKWTVIKPDSSFVFNGVIPGVHRISATAHGLVTKSDYIVNVTEDAKTQSNARDLIVELVRSEDLIVSCGKEWVGSELNLLNSKTGSARDLGCRINCSIVDPNGLAEFKNIRPGEYYVRKINPQLAYDTLSGQGEQGAVHQSQVCTHSSLFELKQFHEAAHQLNAQSKDILFSKGKSAVCGNLKYPSFGLNGEISLFLKGASASGVIQFSSEIYQDWFASDVIGQFKFVSLPAGKYSLYASCCCYPNENANYLVEYDRPIELVSFEIKEDEELKLGDVIFVPPLSKSYLETMLSQSMDLRGIFNP